MQIRPKGDQDKNHLPVFKHLYNGSDWTQFAPGLQRIERALFELGHPENTFQSVVVGGTNGKGSVCHNLAQAWGPSCGLFLSPHLIDVRERITCHSKWFEDKDWQQAYETIKKRTNQHLSYFEWLFLLAVVMFQQKGIQKAVFEVGMGGRLDAVNSLNPVLSVVTNVELDHMEHLGSDRSSIAREKLAIARPNRPLVYSKEIVGLPGIKKMLHDSCALLHPLSTHLKGYGANVELVKYITKLMKWKQVAYTLPPGRRQFIAPHTVLDTAHNLAAWLDLNKWLLEQGFKDYHVLFSLTGNRNPKALMDVFRSEAKGFWTLDWVPENGIPLEQYRLAGTKIVDKLEDLLKNPLLICGSHALVGYALSTIMSDN